MAKYKIFVDGSAGTTGLRIADRLAERADEFELLQISDADRKDVNARAAVINESDLSFLCLPDAAAREVMPLVKESVRILDTSTAHRTAPGWVYGLPELHGNRERIAAANRVAVPGCHASGFITLAAPLVEMALVDADYPFTCYSLTGYSGGGKSMIAQYQAAERTADLDAARPYGLALHHKHLPEMQAIAKITAPPLFVPIVDNYYCGMETMLPLHMASAALHADAATIAQKLADYYAGERMVAVHALGADTQNGFLAANGMAGSDRLEIYCLPSGDGAQLQLISLFDNLGKGSSGAALQCMNLMLGLEETAGLAL